MLYGVREICDVFFKANSDRQIGGKTFSKGDIVCHFDTLKTSTLEGSSTVVYAQGGKGNPRLVTWEGERVVTFTMEDALISPIGIGILTGATGNVGNITTDTVGGSITWEADADFVSFTGAGAEFKIKTFDQGDKVTVTFRKATTTSYETKVLEATVNEAKSSDSLILKLNWNDIFGTKTTAPDVNLEAYVTYITSGSSTASTYRHITVKAKGVNGNVFTCSKNDIMGIESGTISIDSEKGLDFQYGKYDTYGDITSFTKINTGFGGSVTVGEETVNISVSGATPTEGGNYLLSFYMAANPSLKEFNIEPGEFGGNFYIEGQTYFRGKNGIDYPAEFIIPNGKVQSNFTFTMASSGDPSTFTFTVDALEGYLPWNTSKKINATIQVYDNSDTSTNINASSSYNLTNGNSYFDEDLED